MNSKRIVPQSITYSKIVTGLVNSQNTWSNKDYSYYRCASLSDSLSLFLLIFISLFSCLSLSFFTCLSLSLFIHLALSLHVYLWFLVCVVVCVVCVGVSLCVGLCVLLWCVRSKRSRVYVQYVPVCTFKTPVSNWTRAFWTYTRERLSLYRLLASLPSRVSLSILFSCLSLLTRLSFSLAISVPCLLDSFFISLVGIQKQ